MESQNQQQSPQGQGIHPEDATTASNGGVSLISSGGNGDGGPPPQQQQQPDTLTTINSADFFALDGIQYNVPGGYEDSSDDAYNVQQFYQDAGVFSCDDLYAVMDPSNPSGGVTEIDGSAANWQSTGFIPLGDSDIKQLEGVSASSTGGSDRGGSSTSAPGSGPYYRLITLTNEGAQVQAYPPDSNNDSLSSVSSSEMIGGNGNGCDSSAEYMASPAAGVVASSQDGLAPPAKVRKPRGRKPKHVKEAEAAAAAAQVASLPQGEATSSLVQLQGDATGSSPPARRGSLEDIQRPCNSVAAHQPQQTVPPLSPYHHQQRQVISGPIAGPSGNSTATVSRHPQSSQHGQQQLSLERLAYQDRQAILMARRNQENLLRQQQAQTQAQQVSPHRPSIILHHRPSAPQSSFHQHRIPAQSTSANSNPNTQQGRLEQFFSSRIAAPSNKSTVKPKIIQENRGIYNLLTAPTAPCNPPPPASFEKRWMQYPNPSILESESNPRQPSNPPPSSVPCKAVGEGAPTAQQASRQITFPTPQPSSPYAAPSPRKLMDQSSSLFYIGGVGAGTIPSHQQARVNIRRGGDAGSADPLAFHSHPPQRRPHPHEAALGYYAAQQLYRSAGVGSTSSSALAYHQHHNSASGYATISEIEKLRSRIDDMTQIQYDLKYRVNQLTRMNKHVTMKLREIVEEHEDFRAYLRENRDCNSGDGDYLGGGERGGNGRYMMDYGWSDEALDGVLDNPWWLRRRSSVPRRMHRYPQEMGVGGKRPLDGLSVGDEQGKSSKRACSEEGVMEKQGDGKEVEKTLPLKVNDEINGGIGGSQNYSGERGGVDLAGCGVSEEEGNMQKLKLQLESSPPARGETVSPKSIKSVVTEFVTPTSEDGDNTMSTIFNSPLTVGARAPTSTSALKAAEGRGKSSFQACDFATFKSFSDGCGIVASDSEVGKEDGHANVLLINNKVEEIHNDKSQDEGEDGPDKSISDKIEGNTFIMDIRSEIV